MTAVFERILEMSLTAAVVIVVVMLIRLLLRKAPRKYAYALWSVAAFRLVCPVSFRAFFSLFNFTKGLDQSSMESILPDPVVSPAPVVSPGYFDSAPPNTGAPVEIDPDYVFTTYPLITPPEVETPAAPINWVQIAAIVWLVGLTALLIYGIVSYVRLRRRMDTAVRMKDNVWQSDRVQSPFILGVVRPKIYLPFGLSADQQRYVLAHERYHIKRFDHIVRPVSFLILAVHWFNPLVWVAYYMMGRDMEMSCDEKVLSGGESVKDYSTTLLSFAANRRFPSPSPLAFGESGVKGRIKNALNWKKPRTWVTIIAILVCIVVIVVCAANPKEASEPDSPYVWTSTVAAEEVDHVVWFVTGEAGDTVLTEAQTQELVNLLRELKEEDFIHCDSSDGETSGALEIQITIKGEIHALRQMPDGQLIFHELVRENYGAGTYEEWEVDSEELEQFVAGLVDLSVPDEMTTYVSSQCIYMNPLSSEVGTDDSGKTYLIGDSMLAIFDKSDNDAGIFFEELSDWRPLTQNEWAEMFLFQESVVLIGGYKNPMILELSEEYQLINLDGTLWMVHSYGDSGIWDIYQLAEVNQTMTIAQWQADLTGDGVDETITVEGIGAEGVDYYVGATLAVTDASGKGLWSDGFSIGSDEMADFYLVEQGGKYTILEWTARETDTVMVYDYRIVQLDGSSAGMRSYRLRCGLTDEELLALDLGEVRSYFDTVQAMMEGGTLLLGGTSGTITYSTPDKPFTTVWPSPLARLSEMREQAKNQDDVLPQTLAVHTFADLTHDGVRETVTLTYQEELGLYTLTVTNAEGETIWTGEASTMHAGEAGFYLYQRDNRYYLMQWNPYASTGGHWYHYEVFSLTEEGGKVPLVSNTMEFVVINETDLLQLDIASLRAFEQEVNALLEDTILLISTYGGDAQYSTETVTLCKLWTSMADSWEKKQQEILNSMEPLAYWHADLTHDGKKEIIKVSRKTGESTTYYLNIRTTDGNNLWSSELYDWKTGWNGFYLYERAGKYYLLEWFPEGQQGWYNFNYKIYRLSEDAEPEIVEEDSLQYDLGASGYREKILTVDVELLRAFEKKINALLKDAEVLLVVDQNKVLLGNPGAPVSDSWSSPADEWEHSRQAYAAQLPLAWAGWEGSADLLSCVQEQTKLHMGSYELAYIDYPERISTATIGTTSGHFVYRVAYRPADYDAKTHQLTWHDNEYFYLITHEIAENGEWNFVGALTEEELQSRFNTPEMLAKYGDPYTAAAAEMASGMWEQTIHQYLLGFVSEAELKAAGMDLSKGSISNLEKFDPDVGGTSRGLFLYRLTYAPDQGGEVQVYYMGVYHVWADEDAGQTENHTVMEILTEEELYNRYNRDEVLAQYGGDLHLAAALELYSEWASGRER